jgi:hypothetical protein
VNIRHHGDPPFDERHRREVPDLSERLILDGHSVRPHLDQAATFIDGDARLAHDGLVPLTRDRVTAS